MTPTRRYNPSRRGFSLIESVTALVVLAGAMAATVNTVASARASQVLVAERAKSRVLAEAMLREVLAHPYAEDGTTTLGPDAGEAGTHIRNQYDDIDDYHGWSNTVLEPDGTPIPGFEGYILSFQVRWINPDNHSRSIGSDQGLKRVTVTITRNGRVTAAHRAWVAAP